MWYDSLLSYYHGIGKSSGKGKGLKCPPMHLFYASIFKPEYDSNKKKLIAMLKMIASLIK